jgi:hypothetical protein
MIYARVEEKTNEYRALMKTPEGRRPFGKLMHEWENVT